MTRRALIALGVGQCVNWGVLYYAFAVLLVPLEEELGQPTWVVTGAFSLALLMSAVLAPHVGAWCDRGRGSLVMQVGGFVAALMLVLWPFAPGVGALYAVWGVLGLCMAASLYEPAFVVVGRSFVDPQRRLRALAAVTLFGGLASTIFLPTTALLVTSLGWRGAVLVLAAVVAISTAVTRTVAFGGSRLPRRANPHQTGVISAGRQPGVPPGFGIVTAIFAVATFASAGFGANLIPALGERGISPSTAAVLGGLIGVMQLPGRAVLMNGAFRATSSQLLTLSLALHAVGFLGVAFASSPVTAAVGVSVFALGAGLTTLVRPQLVQDMADAAGGGYLNGRIARQQQLGRAAGPLLVATVADLSSYAAVIITFAVVFLIWAAGWQRVRALTANAAQRASA
jgi:MFS family permease